MADLDRSDELEFSDENMPNQTQRLNRDDDVDQDFAETLDSDNIDDQLQDRDDL